MLMKLTMAKRLPLLCIICSCWLICYNLPVCANDNLTENEQLDNSSLITSYLNHVNDESEVYLNDTSDELSVEVGGGSGEFSGSGGGNFIGGSSSGVHETIQSSGSGNYPGVDKIEPALTEVMLAIQGSSALEIKLIHDEGDSKSSNKPKPTLATKYVDIEEETTSGTEQSAYLGHLGTSVNITCFTPEKHFWCGSTSNFAKSFGKGNESFCFTSISDISSSTIDLVHHSDLDDVKKLMYLPEGLEGMEVSVSTLHLKNLSIFDVGSYECFTFYSEEGSSQELQILYQTIYLYVKGVMNNLSVPTSNLYLDEKESDSGDMTVIRGKLGKNIILPCRPVHPNIIVDLFKKVLRQKQKIVDPIEDLLKHKVSSSKFYEQLLTPLFYYHPRIGFVLDSATKEDQGVYHCRFTSSYKYEEIKTFKVIFGKKKGRGLKKTKYPNEHTSSNYTTAACSGRNFLWFGSSLAIVIHWLLILKNNYWS